MFQWQIIFCAWLVSTTTASLLYRGFAVKSQLNPLISAATRSLFVGVPITAVIAFATGGLKMPPLHLMGLVLLEAIIGIAYNYTSFYAIKASDASTFTTVIKTSVVPLTFLSSLLLGEGLTRQQFMGALILLASATLLGRVKLSGRSVLLMLLAIAQITALNLVDRYLVESLGVITTLFFSSLFGFILILPFITRELVVEKKQLLAEIPMNLVLGLAAFLQVSLFVWATDLAGNLSLLYSLSSGKVVIVAIAAAVFLDERDNLKVKLLSALAAAVGIMLI